MKRTKIKTIISTLLVTSFIFSVSIPTYFTPTSAAGIQLFADLTQDVSNPPVPSTVTTQPVFADNTATTVYFGYTASSTFTSGDTVTITFPAGFTLSDGGDTDADNSGSPDGSGAVNGTQWTYTFSASAGVAVEFAISVTAPSATAGNYSVSLSSTNDNDYGVALVYIYDDAGPTYQNRVFVTAQVAPVISLVITDTSNSETDRCNLGVLDIVSVKQCQYRIYPGTNQTTGTATLQISDISTVPGLTKGAGGDVDDIDNTAANTDVVGGTEGYGIVAVPTGTTFTLQGNYNDSSSPGDDPVPVSITTLAQASGYTDGAVGSGNYITMTHRSAADAGTQTGLYTQTVQYTLVSAP